MFGDYKGYIPKESHPHYSEFVSDAVAAAILLGVYTNSIESNLVINQLRYAGIEVALMIFSGLEELGVETSDTHPSFRERIYNVRELVRKWTNDDEQWHNLVQFATSFEQLFLRLSRLIRIPQKVS